MSHTILNRQANHFKYRKDEYEMKMVNRYVYAVIKRLPKAQTVTITQELTSLITDMVDERSQQFSSRDDAIADALEELGDPKLLAEKYRRTNRYLIGPKLFDTYFTVLKIVLFAIVIAVTVGLLIELLVEPNNFSNHIVNYIVSLVTTSFGAFAWVTIIFALVEHFDIDISSIALEKSRDWKPNYLQPIPDTKKQIKRFESVFSIIFAITGFIILFFFSHYVGAYINIDGSFTIIPVLNDVVTWKYLVLITLIFGLMVLKGSLKFIFGKWTGKLVWLVTSIDIISLFLLFTLINNEAIWNSNFIEKLTQTGVVTPGSEGYSVITFIWERSTLIIMIVMVAILVLDVVNGFIKARK